MRGCFERLCSASPRAVTGVTIAAGSSFGPADASTTARPSIPRRQKFRQFIAPVATVRRGLIEHSEAKRMVFEVFTQLLPAHLLVKTRSRPLGYRTTGPREPIPLRSIAPNQGSHIQAL